MTTDPTVALTPNDYLVTFSDARTPWKIHVPNTNVVLNAVTLTMGPMPTFLLSVNSGGGTISTSAPIVLLGGAKVDTNNTMVANQFIGTADRAKGIELDGNNAFPISDIELVAKNGRLELTNFSAGVRAKVFENQNGSFSANAAGDVTAASFTGDGIGLADVYAVDSSSWGGYAPSRASIAAIVGGIIITNPLVAGSNIILTTNGSGAITISSSGGLTTAQVASQISTNTPFQEYDLVRDFGATNDGFFFNNITIARNSTSLAAFSFDPQASGHTNFTTGDSIVGKVIMIWHVGNVANTQGTNNCFTTTVAAVTDSTNIVLATAPPKGVTNQILGGVIGSDNSTFIQRAFNSVSNGSVSIYVPNGTYVVNRANTLDATQANTNNAQIVIPPINSNFSTIPTLRLWNKFGGFQPQAILGLKRGLSGQGATFVSTRTNLNGGSMIDAANYVNPVFAQQSGSYAYIGFNPVHTEFNGINMIGAWNNNGVLLNLGGAAQSFVMNARISSGHMLYNAPMCSYSNTMGVVLTVPSSAGQTKADNLQLCGFYHGINFSEHADIRAVEIDSCVNGVTTDVVPCGHGFVIGSGGHIGSTAFLDFEACKTNVFIGLNQVSFDITCTTEQPDANDWSYPSTMFDNTPGAGHGKIRYQPTSDTDPLVVSAGNVQWERIPKGVSTEGGVTNSYLAVADSFYAGGLATVSNLNIINPIQNTFELKPSTARLIHAKVTTDSGGDSTGRRGLVFGNNTMQFSQPRIGKSYAFISGVKNSSDLGLYVSSGYKVFDVNVPIGVGAAGTGYRPGDILTYVGGTGMKRAATSVVLTTNGTGGVLSHRIIEGGFYDNTSPWEGFATTTVTRPGGTSASGCTLDWYFGYAEPDASYDPCILYFDGAGNVSMSNSVVRVYGTFSTTNQTLTVSTNATAPGNVSTIKAWVNVTNVGDGAIYKMPLYQ